MFSFPAFARLNAKVTISAPPFSMTAFMISSENLPEPNMNRERNLLPPMVKSSSMHHSSSIPSRSLSTMLA
jgi:hypothetical protein